jgi:nitroreductase
VDDAVLLVLATACDDDPDRLRAGEALSHLTLTATALGFASCPVTAPLSETRNRLALACEVFDAEAYPQAMLRFGWPPDGAPLPVIARRPVADTTTWSPG